MTLKTLTWKKEKNWYLLLCGERRVGFVKVSVTDCIKPWIWHSYLTSESGFSDTIEEAKEKAELNFKSLVTEIITF